MRSFVLVLATLLLLASQAESVEDCSSFTPSEIIMMMVKKAAPLGAGCRVGRSGPRSQSSPLIRSSPPFCPLEKDKLPRVAPWQFCVPFVSKVR